MSIELKKVVVGLTQEQFDALSISAEIKGQDKGERARELIAHGLFGELHGLKLVAARFARATKLGNGG